MKKICFVTTVSTTLEAFVLETAIYLYENGNYEITFICNNDETFKDKLPEYISYIPVTMERGISLSGINATFAMYRIFRNNKYDLVQYSTPNASFYASVASIIAGIPVRLYCQWGVAYVGLKGIKRRIFKIIEKVVCSLSTWIEPDSYGNLEFSHNEGLYKKNKSSVIWNGSASGVNLEKFNIRNKQQWRIEIRNQYRIKANDFIYGFVGRLNKDKGINELLKATKEIFTVYPELKLMIVGPDEKSDSVDNELFEWSKTHSNIIYCGFTPTVEKYLSAIDVFILPSYREGFGSVVIEAEAMGIPVIVTDIPGPTDAMINGKTGVIIKKGDVDSLLKAMIYLYENNDLRNGMAKEGYQYAIEKFDSSTLKRFILEDRNRLLRGIVHEK